MQLTEPQEPILEDGLAVYFAKFSAEHASSRKVSITLAAAWPKGRPREVGGGEINGMEMFREL